MPEQRSLLRRTVHALTWSYGATAVQAALQIVLTVVLARLLTPADYGLVAMAVLAVRFAGYFAQMGLGEALVQRQSIDDRDVRATFTSALALGCLFAAACWILAPVVARLFHSPGVEPLFRVLSLIFLGQSLSVTSTALLRRELRMAALSSVEVITSALFYMAPAIVLAARGAGPWSLIIASVLQTFAAAIVYYAITRHPVTPVWDRSVYGRLYSFGSRVSLVGFLEYLCANLDSLWTGRALGAVQLGFYSRAFNLVGLPLYYVISSFTRVLVSAFSRVQDESERIRKTFLPALAAILALSAPAFWGLAGASRETVVVLLGERWSPAIVPLAILAISAPLWLVACLSGMICESTARLNAKIAIAGSQVLLLAVLLALIGRHSINGVAVAMAAGQAWAFAWYVRVVARVMSCRARDVLVACGPGLAAAAVALACALGISALARLAGAPPALALAVQVCIGGAASMLVVLRGFHGRVWRDAKELLYRGGDLPPDGGGVHRFARLLDRLAVPDEPAT